MKKNKESGAIVVEATIALTAFIFMMITLYSIVDIYYIQSRMATALDSAAKEISQYSYLYYKFNIDELDNSLGEGSEENKELLKETIDGSQVLMDSLSDVKQNIDTGNFESLMTSVQQGAGNTADLVKKYGTAIGNDPKGFIFGMAKCGASQISDKAKSVLAQVLARTFMEKNLRDFPDDKAEDFLKRYHVKNGLDGLDFNYSSLMAYGTNNYIQLVVTYEVDVIKLLNIDVKYKFRQVAQTKAWGNGINKDSPTPTKNSGQENGYWGMANDLERGNEIIKKEKDSFEYVSNDNGFHAYDNSNGKNEFVKFVSLDTSDKTYKKPENIEYKLNNVYQGMEAIKSHDESIVVTDKDGKSQTVQSDRNTRTYKIVLVVPENADMNVVNTAVENFEKEQKTAGENVIVEVKKGYGNT